MTLHDALFGAIVVITPEEQRDLVHFHNAVRKSQSRARRRVGRLRRRIEQIIDLHEGYLDLGGEG